MKTFRVKKQSDINILTYRWFVMARNLGYPLSGPILKVKALEIAKKLNICEGSFSASDGWLQRFKVKNNIKHYAVSGESRSCDMNAVKKWLGDLDVCTEGYAPEDIFNADETGYFFKALPNNTLSSIREKCLGGKQSKDRVTVMLTASAMGEKLPLLVIGKSKKPRCLKGVDFNLFNVKYVNSSKAWMTTNIFNAYLTEINEYFSKRNRKILLFIDNAPVHIIDAASILTHVEVKYFPPNLTAEVQPLDAGVIRSLKAHARRLQVMQLILRIDEKTHVSEIARSLTVFDAIKHISRAWDHVKKETFVNCFAKCGFRPNVANLENLTLNALELEDSLLKEIAIDIGISKLVICYEENLPICEKVDDDDLLCYVINDFLDEGDRDNEKEIMEDINLTENSSAEYDDKITNEEAILMTKKLIKYTRLRNFINEEMDLLNLASRIEKYRKDNLKQANLDNFFNKN